MNHGVIIVGFVGKVPHGAENRMENSLFLGRIPLFSGLSAQQLESMASIAVDRPVDKGQIIFVEGTRAEGLYIVLDGRVKIFKTAPDGREAVMHVFGAGEPFGEVAVFQNDVFPANAMAVEQSRVLFLPRRGIVDRIAQDPSLAMNMLAALSRKLRMFTRQVEALTLKEIPQRLAAYLLHLSVKKGHKDVIRLDVSQSLLAGVLGTARETLSRALAKLVETGAITMEGRTITITDREYLTALAEGHESL
jgi:CRP/FNR family transcriptional regulator